MGANEWREAKVWPPPSSPRSFYLGSAASAAKHESNTKIGSLLNDVSKVSGNESFISDPANPVRNPYDSSGAHDYRELSNRSDVLTYDSPVLEADLESTGPIRATIFFSCDCRDTDIWVRLLDVAPDGTALNLMSPGLDVLRASYRDLKRGRQLLSPKKIYELQLTNLISSNVFLKGHRIRIQLSTTFFPNFSRNLQTGQLESTSAQMQKATIRIYHDRKRPSRVTLPIPAKQD
jgi:uncharacterized protein